MGKFIVFFAAIMFFSGCSIVTSGPFAPRSETAKLPRELQLKIGMSQAEVSAIMDQPVIVGYQIDPVTGVSKPVEASSLFSSEFLTKGNKTYQVDKYITRDDDGIAVTVEDLLYPVAFERGLLVAKGREGLEALKKK
jgi:hypothetical protein